METMANGVGPRLLALLLALGLSARRAGGEDATNAYGLLDVVVTADRAAEPEAIGRTSISGAQLGGVPQTVLPDIATGLGTLPGVLRESRFSGLLYIRGSRPYETLFVLNGVPLVNPYKWGGVLLTFNPALVERTDLYTGGFGPEYPETMAGVIEVDYTQGNRERLKGEATLGAETGATVDGPLLKGSAVGSYRRTFYDLFVNAGKSGDSVQYPFYQDWYGSVSQPLSDSDWLWIWCLSSDEGTKLLLDDVAEDGEFKQDDRIQYGARTMVLTADLEHRFPDDSSADVIASFDRETLDGFDIHTGLGDINWTTESDFSTVLATYRREDAFLASEVGGGVQLFRVRKYDLQGALLEPNQDETAFVERTIDLSLDDVAADGVADGSVQYGYAKERVTIGRFAVTPGANVAYSDFMQRNRTVVDPRVQTSYQVGNQTTLRAAAGQYSRHALDYFQVKDNPDLKPERAMHYVTGIEQGLEDDWRVRVELYYKDMRNLIVEDPENENRQTDGALTFPYDNRGEGYAHGTEVYLQKRKTETSRYDGWISYAYATTRRRDGSVDKPDWYSPEYDQQHTIHVVGNHYFVRDERRDWLLTAAGEYHTGRPYEDFRVVGIQLDGDTVYTEDYLGSYRRLPDYFSVDFTLDYVRKYARWNRHLFLELTNATNHKNVLAYYAPRYRNEKREQKDVGFLPFIGLKAEF